MGILLAQQKIAHSDHDIGGDYGTVDVDVGVE